MKTQDSFLVFSLDFCTLIAYIIRTTMRSILQMSNNDYHLDDSWKDDPCDDVTHWLLPLRDQRKAARLLAEQQEKEANNE